jgi:hypothetical protein
MSAKAVNGVPCEGDFVGNALKTGPTAVGMNRRPLTPAGSPNAPPRLTGRKREERAALVDEMTHSPAAGDPPHSNDEVSMTDYEKLSLQIQAALLRAHSDALSLMNFIVGRELAQREGTTSDRANQIGLLAQQTIDTNEAAAKVLDTIAKATQ